MSTKSRGRPEPLPLSTFSITQENLSIRQTGTEVLSSVYSLQNLFDALANDLPDPSDHRNVCIFISLDTFLSRPPHICIDSQIADCDGTFHVLANTKTSFARYSTNEDGLSHCFRIFARCNPAGRHSSLCAADRAERRGHRRAGWRDSRRQGCSKGDRRRRPSMRRPMRRESMSFPASRPPSTPSPSPRRASPRWRRRCFCWSDNWRRSISLFRSPAPRPR